jgi:hypothetical protein
MATKTGDLNAGSFGRFFHRPQRGCPAVFYRYGSNLLPRIHFNAPHSLPASSATASRTGVGRVCVCAIGVSGQPAPAGIGTIAISKDMSLIVCAFVIRGFKTK